MSFGYFFRKMIFSVFGVALFCLFLFSFASGGVGFDGTFTGLAGCVLLGLFGLVGLVSGVKYATDVYKAVKHSLFVDVDPSATIISCDQEKEDYGEKLFKKIKTTVSFSDGFQYVTDKTEHWIVADFGLYKQYTMFVHETAVKEKALAAHERAVKRKNMRSTMLKRVSSSNPERISQTEELNSSQTHIEKLSEEYEDVKNQLSGFPVSKINEMHKDNRISDEQYHAIARKYNALKKRKDELETELIQLGKFD